MPYELIGIIAGILAITGYVPYIYSILFGNTRPNRATWMIWTIVGGLLAFSYIAEGDQHSIWLPLGYFVGPLITAILSIRYGYAQWTKLDTICIVAAVISIIPWILSSNASATLVINVIIDSTGAIPTLVKTYREPETEDLSGWIVFFIANTLQLFAISMWNIAAIYPIYLFLLAGAMVVFIIKGKFKKNPAGEKATL
ncbi:MAG TPA: hypothetical protein VL360_06565 [Gammaproteobacteria bacterium]|jgi:hypothetical protein|nr:hypothetical protein [Gammaproteobacteria bacterium]